MGPDYDDASFWDRKFAAGKDIGEWLNPGEPLLGALADVDQWAPAGESPRVLHLGPGISKLGEKLSDEFVRRGWTGKSIVVCFYGIQSLRTRLTDYSPRMWISPPKPCDSARKQRSPKMQRTQCPGSRRISVPGPISPVSSPSPRSTRSWTKAPATRLQRPNTRPSRRLLIRQVRVLRWWRLLTRRSPRRCHRWNYWA